MQSLPDCNSSYPTWEAVALHVLQRVLHDRFMMHVSCALRASKHIHAK